MNGLRPTPETDAAEALASDANGAVEVCELCQRLERERDEAIDILDGNAPVIDWRDHRHPELLRKLCEHLEAKCNRTHPES